MAFSNKVGSQPAQSGNKYSEGAFTGNTFLISMLTSLVCTDEMIR